jgi:hypothetical protein
MPPIPQRCRVDVLADRTIAAREPVAIAVTDPVGRPIVPLAIAWGDGTNGGPNPHTYAEAQQDVQVMISASMDGRPVFGTSSRFNVLPRRDPHPGAIRPVFWDFPYPPPPDIPAPVADFTISPAAPTDADPIVLTSTSTPEEFIEAWEWGQQMPDTIAPGEGPPVMNLGPQPAGAYVWNLRVRLTDGRWSTLRSRGVQITATEDPEEPEPPPEEPDEPPPDATRAHRRARQH